MASSIFLASPILLVILFYLLLENSRTCFASNPTGKTPPDLRLTLTRVDSGKSLPKNQFAPSSMSENQRLRSLKSRAKASNDLYVTKLAIGTPPVIFSAVVDTGSDLIWTKCQSRLYDSSKSSSFYKIVESCYSFGLPDCEQAYADHESIQVSMGGERLTIGGVSSNITFACGKPTNKKSFNKQDGIIGMGRGKLSLVSQLNISVFSYCLASRFHKSEQSILLTENKAKTAMAQTKTTNVQTTPLLKQGLGDQSFYYISLEGISVGEKRLSVDKSTFAIDNNGRGGMIIDSGTTFTYLEEGIINMIENEFVKQTNLNKSKEDPPYKDLTRCFILNEATTIPKLVFHFKGANWDLPKENYIYQSKSMGCLAFIANDDKLSIFGNMQQQNMIVLYDLEKNSLSFKPANCNQLM